MNYDFHWKVKSGQSPLFQYVRDFENRSKYFPRVFAAIGDWHGIDSTGLHSSPNKEDFDVDCVELTDEQFYELYRKVIKIKGKYSNI